MSLCSLLCWFCFRSILLCRYNLGGHPFWLEHLSPTSLATRTKSVRPRPRSIGTWWPFVDVRRRLVLVVCSAGSWLFCVGVGWWLLSGCPSGCLAGCSVRSSSVPVRWLAVGVGSVAVGGRFVRRPSVAVCLLGVWLVVRRPSTHSQPQPFQPINLPTTPTGLNHCTTHPGVQALKLQVISRSSRNAPKLAE